MSAPDLYMLMYRTRFTSFVRFAYRELHPNRPLHENWHIDVVADYLARCLSGDIKRLIINVPPRTLKSLCALIAFPVLALGRNPNLKIMSIAGNRELASDLHAAMPRTRALSHSQSLTVKHG